MNSTERSQLLADFKQRFDLFKMIWRHRKLAEKRNLSFQQNKAAKYVMWGMTIFVFVYLCFIAILMSLAANASRSYTPVEFVCGTIPFILVLDFSSGLPFRKSPHSSSSPTFCCPFLSILALTISSEQHFFPDTISPGSPFWFRIY